MAQTQQKTEKNTIKLLFGKTYKALHFNKPSFQILEDLKLLQVENAFKAESILAERKAAKDDEAAYKEATKKDINRDLEYIRNQVLIMADQSRMSDNEKEELESAADSEFWRSQDPVELKASTAGFRSQLFT